MSRGRRSSEVLGLVNIFVASGAVLVLEVLAARMLAPYVGISLQSYTGAIGAVLAGIALGAWIGGRLADRLDTARLPGTLLIAGGAMAVATVPAVRGLGPITDSLGPTARILLLCTLIFLPPAAVLSAVAPAVVKLRLDDLAQSGSVVGQYSAVGTAGALTGTFATGFIFIAAWPVPNIVFGLGAILVALGLVTAARSGTLLTKWLAVTVIAGAVAVGVTPLIPNRCDSYTVYYCARVVPHPAGPEARSLILDDLTHSVVDLDHPDVLLSAYAQVMGEVIATRPPGPLRVLLLGGGGMALPRHLATVRPGTETTILEIDPALVDLVETKLLRGPIPDLRVVIGDARLSIEDLEDGSFDVVIGDAFASHTVPWHLTTVEFATELRRVLRPDGIYLMNIIEQHAQRFFRAESATLFERFRDVAAIPLFGQSLGALHGNVLLVAGPDLDQGAIADRVDAVGTPLVTSATLRRYLGDEPPLRDAYAPVDQWFVD